ncbi:MAG: hypothetical protein ACJASZ_002174 [Yoonia sp.]|jgi:hypothetical protein
MTFAANCSKEPILPNASHPLKHSYTEKAGPLLDKASLKGQFVIISIFEGSIHKTDIRFEH